MEVPTSFLSTLKVKFFSLAQTGLETALLTGRPHRGMGARQRLWMSITGSLAVETYGVGGGKIPDTFWKRHPEAIAINAEGQETRDIEYGFQTAVPSMHHAGYRAAVHGFIRVLVPGVPHRKMLYYETTMEPQFMVHQDIDYSVSARRAYDAWRTRTGFDGPVWPEGFPVPRDFVSIRRR